MPKTVAERVKEYEARKKAAGFIKVPFWIREEWKKPIKLLIEKLSKGQNKPNIPNLEG